MQTQKEFTRNLKKAVKKLMGNEYKVEIHCTEKVNVKKLHAFVIINGESAVSPNFYIENFYKDYLLGETTVQEIAEYIVNIYSSHTSTVFCKKSYTFKADFNLHISSSS